MKKILFLMMVVAAMAACSDGDDGEGNNNGFNEGGSQDLIDSCSIVGVWENGDYFISFGEDGFYAAYLNEKFMDSGEYEQKGNEVICKNLYKSTETKYEIKIDGNSMDANILYNLFEGGTQQEKIHFTKSQNDPVEKNSPMIGKSHDRLTSIGRCTMEFETYNTAIYHTNEIKPIKQDWYYFYYNSRAFVQKFKPQNAALNSFYEGCNTGEVYIYEVEFDSNGQIESFLKI